MDQSQESAKEARPKTFLHGTIEVFQFSRRRVSYFRSIRHSILDLIVFQRPAGIVFRLILQSVLGHCLFFAVSPSLLYDCYKRQSIQNLILFKALRCGRQSSNAITDTMLFLKPKWEK